jgi:hypothetical protein
MSDDIDIREIKIIKIPRDKPITSWKPSFKEIDVNSLGLNNLEIKQKLKNNPPTLKSVLRNEVQPNPSSLKKEPPKVEEKVNKEKIQKTTTEDELTKYFAASKEEDLDDVELQSDQEDQEDPDSEEIPDKPPSNNKIVEDEETEETEETEEGSEGPEGIFSHDIEESVEVQLSDEEVQEALTEEPKTVIEEAPPEETPQQKKQRVLRRLRTLKKINPNSTVPIPDFDYDDDLELMERTLGDYTYDLKIDRDVSFYRTLLGGYFIGTEFVSQFLDLDMVQFASSQIKIMHKYDSLLLELSEKNQQSWASNLPVEIRLLGFVVMNTVFHFLFRYITKTKGSAAGQAFASIYESLPNFGNKTQPSAQQQSPPPKVVSKTTQMKGPSVDLQQLAKELGSTEDSTEEE